METNLREEIKAIPPEKLLGELTLVINPQERYANPTPAAQALYMYHHKLDKMTDKHYGKLKKLCNKTNTDNGGEK